MKERLPTGPESLPSPHRRLGMRALDAVMLTVSTIAARNKKQKSDTPPMRIKHIDNPHLRLARRMGFKSIDASPSHNRYTITDVMAMTDAEFETIDRYYAQKKHSKKV